MSLFDKEVKILRKVFPGCKDEFFEGFDIDGLTDSDIVAALDISWAEFHRWYDDGRFPKRDVKVMDWVWKASGKYKRLRFVMAGLGILLTRSNLILRRGATSISRTGSRARRNYVNNANCRRRMHNGKFSTDVFKDYLSGRGYRGVQEADNGVGARGL